MFDATFISFLVFLFALHGLIFFSFYHITHQRYKLIATAIQHPDPIGSVASHELLALLSTPFLNTPEIHYLLKAYHPKGSLWLDDIHPSQPPPPTN